MRISTGKQLTELKRSGGETRLQPASAAVAPASTHDGLPQYDDDTFKAELAALPDQDEAEEVVEAGTW